MIYKNKKKVWIVHYLNLKTTDKKYTIPKPERHSEFISESPERQAQY